MSNYPKTRNLDEHYTRCRPAWDREHNGTCTADDCPLFDQCFERTGPSRCDRALIMQRDQAEREASQMRDRWYTCTGVCRWSYEPEDGCYHTTCGDDVPYPKWEESGERFRCCPNCGGRIFIVGDDEEEV